MSTRLTLYTRLRRRAQDYESPYAIDTGDSEGLFLTGLYAGLARINVDAPHIPQTGYISPDGSSYEWDLSSGGDLVDNSGDPLNTFMKMARLIWLGERHINRHARGMSYIADLLGSDQGITAGNANYYALRSKLLFLDTIIASGTRTLVVSHFAITTDLSGDSEEPQGELVSGWDDFILYASEIALGEDIGGEIGDKMFVRGMTGYERRLPDFKEFVAKQGHLEESDSVIYSEDGSGQDEVFEDSGDLSDYY